MYYWDKVLGKGKVIFKELQKLWLCGQNMIGTPLRKIDFYLSKVKL